MSEQTLKRSELAPHNIDQKTWWYREPRGGLTLVREERDWGFNHIRTVSYTFRVRAGRVELSEIAEGHEPPSAPLRSGKPAVSVPKSGVGARSGSP